MTAERFGAAVHHHRRLRAWSQEELASRTGLHRNHVGAVERGEHRPTLRTMAKLAHGLGIPLSTLIAHAEDAAYAG